jgi:hypothetical protein
MDFLETGDYGVRTPFVEDTSDNNPIIFPAATDAGCVNLSDFLKVAFAGNARFWSPLGNVLCDNSDDNVNNHCQQRSGSDGKLYWERQNSQSSETDPLYWRFNDRTHAIPGAMSFWVQFCKTDTCPDDSRTAIYGYLIIGYGGNGGAG